MCTKHIKDIYNIPTKGEETQSEQNVQPSSS